MTVVDTNILLDVLQDDQQWAAWSIDRLIEARHGGELVINAIVVAELSRNYPALEALQQALSPFELTVEAIDDEAAFIAGRRFVEARQGRAADAPKRPLADFFIGAHALALGAGLLTRDPRLYRRYFPEITLITPETHPHG